MRAAAKSGATAFFDFEFGLALRVGLNLRLIAAHLSRSDVKRQPDRQDDGEDLRQDATDAADVGRFQALVLTFLLLLLDSDIFCLVLLSRVLP